MATPGGAAAPAPPPGYPTGQGPLLPEGEPAEVSQRGLANTLQQGVNVVRRMEHTAHAVAHPVDHARWKLSYWPKRMMHRAVDKCCCSIQ